MRWFTSDTHFGHARIIELCNRPFADIDEMDQTIIDNWNSVVQPSDEVFHLGDVALGPKDRWQEIFHQLNGRLVLVIGNHDALYWENKPRYIEKYAPLYRRFDVAGRNLTIPIDGQLVMLAHFSYDPDYQGRGMQTEDFGFPLIHGHTHGTEHDTMSSKGTPQFHVGMDAWNYFPVSENRIIAWLRNLEKGTI
jgi:calcineurin-like phosphoesterase family protein